MKKILSALLAGMMILCAGSVVVSASDVPVDKTYAEAADGDLLYTADFSNPNFAVLGVNDGFNYTVSDGGATVTIDKKPDNETDQNNTWGVVIDALSALNGEKYTVTYKVRANGAAGKNNSIGVGIVTDGGEDHGGYTVYNLYGNHNTVTEDGSIEERRATFSLGGAKMTDYDYTIKNADEDENMFITIKQEIDTVAKTIKAWAIVNGEWAFLQEQPIEITETSLMGVFIRSHYFVIDTTVTDLKIYRGTGLTDEQLAGPVEEVPAAEEVTTAPQTFDMGVVCAVAAVISAAGYAVSRKKN